LAHSGEWVGGRLPLQLEVEPLPVGDVAQRGHDEGLGDVGRDLAGVGLHPPLAAVRAPEPVAAGDRLAGVLEKLLAIGDEGRAVVRIGELVLAVALELRGRPAEQPLAGGDTNR